MHKSSNWRSASDDGGGCGTDDDKYFIGTNKYHLNDILLSCCVLDNLLGLVAVRAHRYYGEGVNRGFSGGICLLILNEDYIGSHVLRGGRALLGVCKSKGLRVTIGGMAATLPRIWQVLVIYVAVTTFYALLAMEYLHMYYSVTSFVWFLDINFINKHVIVLELIILNILKLT